MNTFIKNCLEALQIGSNWLVLIGFIVLFFNEEVGSLIVLSQLAFLALTSLLLWKEHEP